MLPVKKILCPETKIEYKVGPACLLYEFDDKQLKKLKEFQKLVKDSLPEVKDLSLPFLAQWLMARDFDMTKAMKMLDEHEDWKNISFTHYFMKRRKLDPILQTRFPGGYLGKSKQGHPVLYIILDSFDIHGLRHTTPYGDFLTARLQYAKMVGDICQNHAKETGMLVDQCYGVIDMNNLRITDFVSDYRGITNAIDRIITNNFPENTAKMFVVNGYRIMSTLFSYFSVFLTERIKQKINVLGPNDRDKIFEYIDRDQVPAYYGGTMFDPVNPNDPKCSSLIRWVETFPSESYRDQEVRDMDKSGMTNIHLNAGQSVKVLIGHTEKSTFIKWTIICEHHDVAFSLAYTPNKDEDYPEILEPSIRINAHLVPERGQFPTKWPGYYYLVLDNSYSSMHGKSVFYATSMDEVDEYK